jgi:hypothetical protein
MPATGKTIQSIGRLLEIMARLRSPLFEEPDEASGYRQIRKSHVRSSQQKP